VDGLGVLHPSFLSFHFFLIKNCTIGYMAGLYLNVFVYLPFFLPLPYLCQLPVLLTMAMTRRRRRQTLPPGPRSLVLLVVVARAAAPRKEGRRQAADRCCYWGWSRDGWWRWVEAGGSRGQARGGGCRRTRGGGEWLCFPAGSCCWCRCCMPFFSLSFFSLPKLPSSCWTLLFVR
jgi:hypothetical protein